MTSEHNREQARAQALLKPETAHYYVHNQTPPCYELPPRSNSPQECPQPLTLMHRSHDLFRYADRIQENTFVNSTHQLLDASSGTPADSDMFTDVSAAMSQLRLDIEDASASIIEKTVDIRLEKRMLERLWDELFVLQANITANTSRPMSYDDFVAYIDKQHLDFLLDYIDQVDRAADYAVAPTNNPNKKRCKVGRPKGKILKRIHGDNLDRGLCSMHCCEDGFNNQVLEYGRPPWECYPKNLLEEDGQVQA